MPTEKKPSRELLTPGRKRRIDAEISRKLAQALAWDCTVEEACAYAGISDTTYCQERHRNTAFAEEMGRAHRLPSSFQCRVAPP